MEITGHPTVTLAGDSQAQADAFMAAFDPNAPGYTPLKPPDGATTPVDVVVTFGTDVQFHDADLAVPPGIRVGLVEPGVFYTRRHR